PKPDYGKRYKSSNYDELNDATSVIKGGYFLLGKEYGSRGYLSQSKICKRKYYDDIGASSISTCSSSPLKVSF
uniref:Uncharacterized protein n=1 Tax=Panagrolaimus sp. PS1159 TaxID=55785 RepID=A0AC35FME5_9BILA